MTETDFLAEVHSNDFADLQSKGYAPDIDGPLHTHDFAVMLLVTAGEFALQYEDRKETFRIGECCTLAANVMHAERAGPEGAVVLLAKKKQAAVA